MKKRSRKGRKISWLRIGLIFLVIFCAAGLAGWLTGRISLARQQSSFRSQLEAKITEARDVQDMAAKAVYERNIDAESFNAIVDYADDDLAGYIRTLQLGMQSRISPEQFNELMALKSPADSYRRILSNLSFYSREQAAAFAADKSLLEYMAYYPSREDHMTPPETIASDLDWFPYVSQWNPDWAYLSYQGSTIGEAGSRPVTIAMAIAHLSGDLSVTPYTVAQKLDDPALTEEETLWYGVPDLERRTTSIFSEYGISETELSADADTLNNALDQNGLILIRAAAGTPDHWMLALKDSEGKMRVLDSEAPSQAEQEWTVDDLLSKGTQYLLLAKN